MTIKTFANFLTSQTNEHYLTEIIHFHHLLTDKGEKFINDLLTKKVVISIKVDQFAFVVSNEGGELKFYAKGGKKPVNLIKRIGMNLYEKGIQHIQSRPWQKLPDGLKVFMECFNDSLKSIIKYKMRPKNDLIINYLQTKDGKILQPDHPLYTKVAKILDVSPPAVLFSGKLSARQKKKIMEFLKATSEERLKKFSSDKFMEFITGLFVPPDELKWLVADGWEGVVWYFDGFPTLAKIVDPGFTAKVLVKKDDTIQLSNQYFKYITKIIFDNVEPLFQKLIKKTKPSSGGGDKEYIKFISDLSQLFVNKMKKRLDTELLRFKDAVKQARFTELTYTLVPPQVKQMVKNHWWAEDVFRILLFELRKKGKHPNPNLGMSKQHRIAVRRMFASLEEKGIR